MVARRRAGEPLQYVLGSWGFRRLDLLVDRRVLIPRPETEQVVEVALELLAGRERPLVVADLGTGSGAIALSLARELPSTGVEVWATDISTDALDVARANLAGLGRAAVNVRLAEGDWFGALPADRSEGASTWWWPTRPTWPTGDDARGGGAGLGAGGRPVRRGRRARRRAGPGGRGRDVAAARRLPRGGDRRRAGWRGAALARGAGLAAVAVRPDLAGRDRVLVAQRRPESVC